MRPADHLTSCIPRSPVNALALPLFTSNARARPEVMLSRHQITGADAVLDRVKTPAAVVPCDKAASSRSLRRRYLIPAAATANRTPATSGMRGKRRGASGDLETSGNCSTFSEFLYLSQLAVAMFVFFSGAARTQCVTANLGSTTNKGLRSRRSGFRCQNIRLVSRFQCG